MDARLDAWLVSLLHLGSLHASEKVLVAVLALGPFLALGVVVAVQRRRAVATEPAREAPEPPR